MVRTFSGTGLVVSDRLYQLTYTHRSACRIAGMIWSSATAQRIIRTDIANHLDIEDDGTLSYLPPKRFTGGDGFHVAGRMRAKPGRVLRKILTDDAVTKDIIRGAVIRDRVPPISDADIEQLAVCIQAESQPIAPFIVTGEAIRWWYSGQNYTKHEESTLHNSCMRYSGNWFQTRFYARNPRTIGMICVLGPDNKLAARAILWNTDQGILMDRCFGSDRSRTALRAFAKTQGWLCRRHDGAEDTGRRGEREVLDHKGTNVPFLAVPLQSPNATEYPYFDTAQSVARLHATGDEMGALDRWMSHSSRNPLEYGAMLFGFPSADHFMNLRHSYTRAEQEKRDRIVDFCSRFDHIPPWPVDLLRTDPSWKLPDDPEDDALNWGRLPTRRTTALSLVKPEPATPALSPIQYGPFTSDGLGFRLESLREYFRALEEPPSTYHFDLVPPRHLPTNPEREDTPW